jgi:hypothetical protein
VKTRIQVSLNPELLSVAREIMKTRKFDTVSEFLEALIREEWERRYLRAPLDLANYGRSNETHPAASTTATSRSITYRKSRQRK